MPRTLRRHRVTASFIRNLRKGYLLPSGEPQPGKQLLAAALLNCVRLVQEGDHDRAESLGRIHGLNLEAMYSEYRNLIREVKEGRLNIESAVQEWCDAYGVNIRLRVTTR